MWNEMDRKENISRSPKINVGYCDEKTKQIKTRERYCNLSSTFSIESILLTKLLFLTGGTILTKKSTVTQN